MNKLKTQVRIPHIADVLGLGCAFIMKGCHRKTPVRPF